MPVLWKEYLGSGVSFQVELPQKEQPDLAWAWRFPERCIDGQDQRGPGPFLPSPHSGPTLSTPSSALGKAMCMDWTGLSRTEFRASFEEGGLYSLTAVEGKQTNGSFPVLSPWLCPLPLPLPLFASTHSHALNKTFH